MTTVDIEPPKIVDNMPAVEYHGYRDSVSSTGLRSLIAPGCPALFRYEQDHPKPPKRTFDIGTATHTMVLGFGERIIEMGYGDYRKKDAQADRDWAYSQGHVPLLPSEYKQVQTMADSVLSHPVAGPLFTGGVAERSVFFTDPATGVRCRVRPDFWKDYGDLQLIVDLKTCADPSPEAVSKSIYDFHYEQQAALYIRGVQEATGAAGARFVFVAVGKTAPHIVTVFELPDQDLMLGEARNDRALRTYRECMKTGVWPDWQTGITEIPKIGMPSWAAVREADEYLK